MERMTTVAQTLRRQGKNVLKFIQGAVASSCRNEEAPMISEALGF